MASCQECWPGYSKAYSKSKPLEILVVNKTSLKDSVINGPLERKLHNGKDLVFLFTAISQF